MAARFMQNTVNVGATSEASLLRFPSTGRSSGRIDSVLLSQDYTGAYPGVAGARDGELRIYIDDISASPSSDYQLTFAEAARVSDSGLEIVKFEGDATYSWSMMVRFRGLFRYFFEIKAYNAQAAPRDMHTTVFFEEF